MGHGELNMTHFTDAVQMFESLFTNNLDPLGQPKDKEKHDVYAGLSSMAQGLEQLAIAAEELKGQLDRLER